MHYLRTAVASLTLVVGTSACFFPLPPAPWQVDRFEAEHRDPHIMVIESEPPPERGCWRHGNHWHCHQDDD
jgi:hypothetical protein